MKTKRLDILLRRWETTFSEGDRAGFHRDGIINEIQFQIEKEQILFIMLEPNSRNGKYDRYFGWDLRKVYGQECLNKELTLNTAVWTQAILDGKTEYVRPSPGDAQAQLHRVAIMNLKKIAGTGRANYRSIEDHAWKDETYIKKEIEIISPTVVVSCGYSAHRLFTRLIKNDPKAKVDKNVLAHATFLTLPGYHPSIRPLHARRGLDLIVENAKKAKVGYWRNC